MTSSPVEGFLLLSLPNATLSFSSVTESGVLALECITEPVFLILRINAVEVPLDPARVISLCSSNSDGRVYIFHGSEVDPTEMTLTVTYAGGDLQEDLNTFESVLSQYAQFHDLTDPTSSERYAETQESPLPSGSIDSKRQDLRGHLVLVNEDNGEVVGEVEKKFTVQEDPALGDKAHENDPVVIEIPEESFSGERAIEVFARTVPPDQQDWITKSAKIVSQGISYTTNLLVNVMTSASSHYIASTPSSQAPPSVSNAETSQNSTNSTSSQALLFLTSERTRKGLTNVHAVSTQAVKISSKTISMIDGMIGRALGSKGKAPAARIQTPAAGSTSFANGVGSRSTSTLAPPPYSSTPNLVEGKDLQDSKPPLPPRRSPSPLPGTSGALTSSGFSGRGTATPPARQSFSPQLGTSAAASPPGSSGRGTPALGVSTPPPLPPRDLSTKARIILSADLILSTLDESTKQVLDVGAEKISAVVGHKYGKNAAHTSYLMGGTVKNVALVYIDMQGIGRKALLKKVGKQYVKNQMKSIRKDTES